MTASDRFDNALRYRSEDHPNQTALTPDYILDPVRQALGGIDLDPCTIPENPVAASRFYAPPQDGAALPWDAATIYVNPPYGKARERWVKRCIKAGAEGRAVVLLIPAHTDTRIFQEALRSASSVVFIRGRVKFGTLRPNRRQVAASHPSALIGWNVDLQGCAHLGHRLSLDTAIPWRLTRMTPTYLKARTIERERVARSDYRYYRADWYEYRSTCKRTAVLVARERWSVLHDLLREPDWVEELALLAGGAA